MYKSRTQTMTHLKTHSKRLASYRTHTRIHQVMLKGQGKPPHLFFGTMQS